MILLDQLGLAWELNAGRSCDKMLMLILFLAFSGFSPRGYKNRCFLVALCGFIVYENELSGKQNSPSVGKKTKSFSEPF